MYIIAGSNQLTITKKNVFRDNGVGLILKMEVPRDSITISDLEAITKDIEANAREIIVYNDSDEKIEVLTGFHFEPYVGIKGSIYTVELINESENTYQIQRLKAKNEELEKTVAAQENTISEQATILQEQASVISEQGNTITAQAEQVTALEEMNVMQMSTIDSLLLDVIPSVITDAVTVAVEEALASNSSTEAETGIEKNVATEETTEEVTEAEPETEVVE